MDRDQVAVPARVRGVPALLATGTRLRATDHQWTPRPPGDRRRRSQLSMSAPAVRTRRPCIWCVLWSRIFDVVGAAAEDRERCTLSQNRTPASNGRRDQSIAVDAERRHCRDSSSSFAFPFAEFRVLPGLAELPRLRERRLACQNSPNEGLGPHHPTGSHAEVHPQRASASSRCAAQLSASELCGQQVTQSHG